ncbi:class I SAM-dependent methyltransferase [Shewanella sp. Isolate13]|uniref:class I SAM-dependent methyltransferase n=1 Tax=Shewanella sp. Isolate13 TaxID=2908531 RepID=UPI001EFC855E|nr:class I SAM-dependent methyltransferase [Shewanella sp. Isolate13]MCG9729228.1 class I SAM-dependent methyltransferase [Shewanella sp. Isolate13]
MAGTNSDAQQHTGNVIDNRHGFNVIDCEECGFKHVSPMPTAQELEQVYREEYYTKDKPLFLSQSKEDAIWWERVFADRFDTFEAHLPVGSRRVFDVGAGPGFFLHHGQQRGWETQGIEPSKQASEHARELGLDVVSDFLSPASVKQFEPFDVVHACNVLEHIPNPIELLECIHLLVKDGGLVCISVPNDYNPFQKTVREVDGLEPWWLAPPHHLNYFDVNSLTQLLNNSGFDVFLKESSFPIDMFLLMGDNYVGNDELGRACHKKRMKFEMSMIESGQNDLKRAWYQSMAEIGVGREICIYARKRS